METSKKERPVVAKRPFVKETSKEDESVEVKSRRRNLESKVDEQIVQEKQRIMENLKDLQARKSKLQVQINEQLARLKELTGSGPSSETGLPDEVLLKILSYLSTYDVVRNVARVSKNFKKLSEDPFLIRKIELEHSYWYKYDAINVLKTSKNLKFISLDTYI